MANRNFRSSVSVAAQSKEVAPAGCEGSPNSAKQRTSLVTKIFNTLPVSSCYLSQGIPGNRGKGKGLGEGMLHIDLIAVNCSSRSPWIVGKTQNDVTWKLKQLARGTI